MFNFDSIIKNNINPTGVKYGIIEEQESFYYYSKL